MRIAVIGATGTIGKAVATLLQDQGHEVIRASRTSQPGVDVTEPTSIVAFYKAIGEVDAVIYAAAGTSSYCTVSEISDEALDQDLKSKVLGQVNLVRHGLSTLRPGGVFILTGGIFFYNPWPKSSVIAMVNGALEGFVRGAALDLQDSRRIVIIHPPAVREWAVQIGMDGSALPPVATVAQTYLKALEGKSTGQPVFVDGYDPS